MAAMQHYCRHNFDGKLAIWILGGGVPKNYTLQGEPLLDQILNVPTHGFDIDVQFCVDPVDNGALSSCPAGEGHTWGKVSVEAVETGSMYVPHRRDGRLPVADLRADAASVSTTKTRCSWTPQGACTSSPTAWAGTLPVRSRARARSRSSKPTSPRTRAS
jgi:hypothetical protein